MKSEKYKDIPTKHTDVFIVGAGIMSATLATLIRIIKPTDRITIVERLPKCGQESSDSLNNAGTGHAGYCELNYTPMDDNGKIDITKAVKVNKAFQKSLDFWGALQRIGVLTPKIYNMVPHYTFVEGRENVEFLRKRHYSLRQHEAFSHMVFSDYGPMILNELPLIMEGREIGQHATPVAITKAYNGFDVDFGLITKQLIAGLKNRQTLIRYNQEVIDLYKDGDLWYVIVKNLINDEVIKFETEFVFIGAGGAAINLLEKSEIPEGKGYGGFPVSGEWLICKNQDVVERHNAKVYGRPSVGSPPMSVPHLDTRIIDGEKCLLFGPFAGMSTKFLKNGSYTDFFKSIRLSNIGIMLDAGARNLPLTKYLAKELIKGPTARFNVLKSYYPKANKKDWQLSVAGQRVQVIKQVDGKGVIEFGTEIVTSKDGSLACLLGASPGASTSVSAMLEVLEKCFVDELENSDTLSQYIPTYKSKKPCIS